MTDEPLPEDAPSNLFEPVPGDYGAHGRFDAKARSDSWEMFTDRHREAVFGIAALMIGLYGLHRLAKRLDI